MYYTNIYKCHVPLLFWMLAIDMKVNKLHLLLTWNLFIILVEEVLGDR